MAKRQTSIKQVAEAAGVSTATVSNVFSGKKAVMPELAERVRKVAGELGYSVNRAASNLRSGESRIVPVLVPDLSDPFFTSLIMEIEGLAQIDGYEIIIANTKDDAETERGRISALLSWQPAGMIIVPVSDDIPDQLDALRNNLPIVLADRGTEAEGFDTVRVDNAAAGAEAAAHLVELGHRSVLIVASDTGLYGVSERCRGAAEMVAQAGGKSDIVEVGPAPNLGAKNLARWLGQNQMPTAIFAVTDMTTLATLTCLAEIKAEIGKDISVVGFDDYPWMSARRTPITAIRQPIEDIAKTAWTTLKRRMDDNDDHAEAPPLKCTMKIRASTQKVSQSGNKSIKLARKLPMRK